MSSQTPPRTPQPRGSQQRKLAPVYWRRRAVALTVLGVLVWFIAGWLAPDDPPTPPASRAATSEDRPTSGSRVAKAGASGDGSSARDKSRPDGRDGRTAKEQKAREQKAKARAAKRREAERRARLDRARKSGPRDCRAGALAVRATPAKAKLPGGFPLPIRIKVQNGSKSACKIVATPAHVRVVVMSNERIWDTEHCPRALRGGRLTLKPGAAKSFVVAWNGRHGVRTTKGRACSDSAPSAAPGRYSVQVAVAGSLSDPASFTLI